jgi:large subunit ribosomal protein L4
LSRKLLEDKLVVLDRFELDQIKTKKFLEIMNLLNLQDVLIVTDRKDENLELSSRNVSGVKVLLSNGLNVYDILKHKNLVLLESSIKSTERRLMV